MGFGFSGLGERVFRAYADAVATRGPDDIYTLKKALETSYAGKTLAQLAAFLRLTEWDPAVIAGMYDPLCDAASSASPVERASLRGGLLLAWRRYYGLDEEDDFAFKLGNLFAAIGYYEDALRMFVASREAYGLHEDVQANIELCQHLLADAE
jgi:hypothetical protein